VGRKVNLEIEKKPMKPGKVLLKVDGLSMRPKHATKDLLKDITLKCMQMKFCALQDRSNGQSELVYALTGMTDYKEGSITLNGTTSQRLPYGNESQKESDTFPKTDKNTDSC
jgi:simple sugar transport system ATP-binding protein